MALVLITIRIACSRLRLLSNTIAPNQDIVSKIFSSDRSIVSRLIDDPLYRITAHLW